MEHRVYVVLMQLLDWRFITIYLGIWAVMDETHKIETKLKPDFQQ